jgi:hypothetical protein
MDDSNILWGDLFDIPTTTPAAHKLTTRRTIQKHYPVFVRVQQSDKTLGIQWRMSKLAEWRVENPNPIDWKPYEAKTAREMIDVLRNSGWDVSAPTHPAFICSITRQTQKTPQTKWNYEELDCPTLICLNDIKLFFPVIWHKLDTNCKTYSLELYNDKIRSMSMSHGVDSELLTNHLSSLLKITLEQSPAWNVQVGNLPNELCKLCIV